MLSPSSSFLWSATSARTARRRWRSAARTVERVHSGHVGRSLPPVILMTDPARTRRAWNIVSSLPCGWAVIYRHFGEQDRYHTALRIVTCARRRHLRVLISADPELARRTRADGVHWPQHLLPSRVRRLRPHWIVTAAAHDACAIARARSSGADAAIVSPVWVPGYDRSLEPLGVRRFSSLVSGALIPCYGLGGVTCRRSGRIARHGGIAAVDGLVTVFAQGGGSTSNS